MERRAFVTGAFGLAVIAAGAGVFASQVPERSARAPLYTTPASSGVETAVGPVMQPAIELVSAGEGIAGYLGDSKLFVADDTAATLIMLADGTRNLYAIARDAAVSLGVTLDPADVASFFVELAQAGFLLNEVFVNLYEVSA